MKLPDKIFGREVEGALERYLEASKNRSQTAPRTSPQSSVSVPNPGQYISLEGRQHGSYSYPDLLVAMERGHHDNNWNLAYDSLVQEGAYMLTIRQFVDFLELLKSGKVYNGAGQQIDSREVDKVLDEILTTRSPWRSEWLDAKFAQSGRNLTIAYHKINSDGTSELVTEPLEECLMADKTPGIDLDSYLRNATYQGLPSKNTTNGNLHYWHPRNGTVARFRADSYGAGLDCYRDPRYPDSLPGVRAARLK